GVGRPARYVAGRAPVEAQCALVDAGHGGAGRLELPQRECRLLVDGAAETAGRRGQRWGQLGPDVDQRVLAGRHGDAWHRSSPLLIGRYRGMARARRAWRGPESLQCSRIGGYRQAPGHSPGETRHELGPLPVPAQPQPQLAPVADHRIDEVLAAEPAGLEGRLPPPPQPQADADVVTDPVLPLPALEECLAEACPELQGLLGKLQPWSAVHFEDF